MIRNLKPMFVVSPKIISFFEIFSPIAIGAITLGPIVISKEPLSDSVKNHEAIHYQQYIELFFIGFIMLYLSFWIINLLRGMKGSEAYFNIPFEKEAYYNDANMEYLKDRERYAWARFLF